MPESAADQQKADNKQRSGHDRALVIATIVTAVGACFAAAFSGWQAYLTRENSIISQRAFMSVDPPQVMLSVDPSDGMKKKVSFNFPMRNNGNTPTKDLKFIIKCASSLESLSEPWILLFKENIEHIPQFIAPHQAAGGRCGLPFSHILDVKDHKAFAYLLGEITYRDRLNDSVLHKTQMSLEIVDINIIPAPGDDQNAPTYTIPPTVNISFTSKGRHNCADEECP